jgi:hypothetical protein
MSTVQEIKAAIDKLSPQERCELNALLQTWPEDEWDKKMDSDSQPGGKLAALKEQAEAEARSGQLRDFPTPRR